MNWNQGIIVFLGCWLLASPWVLQYSEYNLVKWNAVIVGVLVIFSSFSHVVRSKD